jgi:hypothetical protein
MRKVSLLVVMIAALVVGTAQPSQAQSSDSDALIGTAAGVVIGGALLYYFYPVGLITSTALGAVVGGAIGNWWYNSSDAVLGATPHRAGFNGEPAKPFRLIDYREGRPTLRPADHGELSQ